MRKEQPALRLGDVRFFQAEDGKIGFSRSYEGEGVKIYVNQSSNHWEIPEGNVLMSHWLQNQSIAPGGFCIMED